MMKMIPKVNDCYGDVFADGGVFSDLFADYQSPPVWLHNYTELDIGYHYNHGGDKIASPLLRALYVKNDLAKLTTAQRETIAKIIKVTYNEKWVRLYNVILAEYNPIENYNMRERETPNLSTKSGVSEGFSENIVQKTAMDYKTVDKGEGQVGVYGFNSVSAVSANETGTENESRVTGDADDNTIETEKTQTGYREESRTGYCDLERSGNIGVTTSQQMLESEINLWQWNFYDQVFADIDKVLALEIY